MLKSAAARSASSLSLQAASCICRNLPAFHSLLVRLRLPRTLSRDRFRSCPAVVPAQSRALLHTTMLLQQALVKLCRLNRVIEQSPKHVLRVVGDTQACLGLASLVIRASAVWLGVCDVSR